MKKTISFILLVGACFGCMHEKHKMDADKVDVGKVKIAKDFTNEFFSSSKLGDTMNFENRVAQQLSNVFNKEEQMGLYREFNEHIGEYTGCEFAEAWDVRGMENYQVFRFKSLFEGNADTMEIRVVVDEKDLIAAYYIGIWDDAY